MVRKRQLSKVTCRTLLKSKFQKLHDEGFRDKQLAAIAIEQTRKRYPSCSKFFPKR